MQKIDEVVLVNRGYLDRNDHSDDLCIRNICTALENGVCEPVLEVAEAVLRIFTVLSNERKSFGWIGTLCFLVWDASIPTRGQVLEHQFDLIIVFFVFCNFEPETDSRFATPAIIGTTNIIVQLFVGLESLQIKFTKVLELGVFIQ